MKIDSSLTKKVTDTADAARAIEAGGYDGLWVGETKHDPFLQVLMAAQATERLTVGTSIAIAFARTPMTLAHSAFDLAQCSSGRFVLGLGSQIKPHVEKRFGMPWSQPAKRMREFVLALHAIWACWQDGTPLDFRGEFYRHTLMTPFFSPDPHPFGPPPVYLAGVGERMTEVAGEVCDGFFFHPLTTSRYMSEVTLPALERGRALAGRPALSGGSGADSGAGGSGASGFAFCGPAFVCAGRTEEEMAVAAAGTKAQIAFYASTPAYRPVLELHGWGDLQPELTALSKQGRWADMGNLIDDEMLSEFAAVGDPQTVATVIHERFGPVATRIQLYVNYPAAPGLVNDIVTALRAA